MEEWPAQFGTPDQNPAFWDSISANSYLADLSGPLQLHHGTQDGEVPLEFSQTLAEQVQAAGGKVELYTYPGDNHNISNYFSTAMQRTITFFDEYLK
jgi:dipeptidyl aminopeptidase/acylaminoacyl peptidase